MTRASGGRSPDTECEGISLAELLSLMGDDATLKTARDAIEKLTSMGIIVQCPDHPGFYKVPETPPARAEKVPSGLRRLLRRLPKLHRADH